MAARLAVRQSIARRRLISKGCSTHVEAVRQKDKGEMGTTDNFQRFASSDMLSNLAYIPTVNSSRDSSTDAVGSPMGQLFV